MNLVNIVSEWMKEDEFLNTHFMIRPAHHLHTFIGLINMSCYHDAQYRSYDTFTAWVLEDRIESDLGDRINGFSDRWITIMSADPNFFPEFKRFMYEVHAYYGKYCRPKWTHPKK